jgi:hypothetical protein
LAYTTPAAPPGGWHRHDGGPNKFWQRNTQRPEELEMTYIANIGPEAAGRFAAPLTDFEANGITVQDLGDGRIRFGQDALDWMRDYDLPDDDGYITDDEYGLRMWVDGTACNIWREG